MARKFDGVLNQVISAVVALPATAISIHLWYKNTSAPNTTDSDSPFSWRQSDGIVFKWDALFGQEQTWRWKISAGFVNLKYITALGANTWYGLGYTNDNTTARIYLNGVEDANSANGVPVDAGSAKIVLGAGGDAFEQDDGTSCRLGAWNVALSASEMRALGSGVSPIRVRPTSLVVWWEAFGGTAEPDFSGQGLNGTVTGTTIADHGPIAPAFGFDQWVLSTASQTLTKPLSLDAIVQSSRTLTGSLSAAVMRNMTANLNLDAAAQAARLLLTSLAGAVQATGTDTASLDAAVQIARSLVASLNTAILASRTLTASIDANVQATLTKIANLDAAIQSTRTLSATLDAGVSLSSTMAVSLDTLIALTRTLSARLDACILATLSLTLSLDASIKAAPLIIEASSDRTYQVGARNVYVVERGSATLLPDGRTYVVPADDRTH